MAARKAFFQLAAPDAELEALIVEAVKEGITAEELKEQRVSFAYGNAKADANNTKDSVREASRNNLLAHA